MRSFVHFIPVTLALGLAAAAAPLAGCAPAISASSPPGRAAAPVATEWHAPLPLPHSGQLAGLSQWWTQFDDPLMLRLIEAGQQVSPTVAEASARIADARAARVSSRAALMPLLDASADSSRGRQAFGGVGPVSSATLSTAGVQASWELDLFGAARAGVNAARARLESTQAGWHDARVSVAAEVATTYTELRACEVQVRQAELDASSRAQTSQLTRLAVKAGFQAPAAADQANASAAQGAIALIQQRTQCELLIKALTALTAQDEAALRRDLITGSGRLPRPAELRVAAMPAEVLAQRPDICAAARDVMAASGDSAQARRRRWPRITLAGNIGTTRIAFEGQSTTGSVWAIGPVTVTLPLFDGGTRRANAQAARARYEAAATIYSARLREAIRDVESALVTLESTAQRSEAALVAADGFERSFKAVEASYQAGLASLFDLEDARRSMVAAQSALIELQRERVSAWIALYRALGGGWSSAGIEKTE
jgi:outer membrane protein, multidrug efflux system